MRVPRSHSCHRRLSRRRFLGLGAGLLAASGESRATRVDDTAAAERIEPAPAPLEILTTAEFESLRGSVATAPNLLAAGQRPAASCEAVDAGRLTERLSDGMTALLGADPWRRLFGETDTVAIKINGLAAGRLSPRPELVLAIVAAGLLEIKINTAYLEAPDIDLLGEKNEIKIALNDSVTITGWYGFLKRRSGFRYGFNLYKHGRLIKAEEKFGFEPHAEVALLYGVLNMDFVPTTHNKREFIESSYEYKLAEDAFKKYLKDNKITVKARELSKSKTESKRKEKVKDDMDEFFEAIYELLKKVKKGEQIDLDQPKFEIKEKEEIEKIKLLYEEKAFNLQNIEEGNFYELNLMSQKYKFKFDLVSLGKEKDIVQFYQENHNVTILINIDFPVYEYVVKDYGLYALMLISEVIAKIVVKELNYNPETLLQIRNLMLRKYGEMQKEMIEQEKLEEEERRLMERIKKIKEKKKSLKE